MKSGALHALATTGSRRAAVLPDVPTMEESGFPGFVIAPWWGVLAPKATPPAIVKQLNQVMNEILKDPKVKERFAGLGLEVSGGPPERLEQYIRSESAKWGALVRARQIRAQ